VRPRRRIDTTPDGEIRLRLPRRERSVLRAVAAELSDLLERDAAAPELERLFPPAYEDDDAGEAEYRRLAGDDLVDGRLASLRVLDRTIDRDRLTGPEAQAWLGVLNDLRLVLGTRLDVREDTFARGFDRRHPRARELATYAYLTWLQEQLVAAVAASDAR
jgi:hypothetical protein